tara:strand:+ start:1752 stop:2396 length:645 start_codon:yes stop_codon:yes gene_type:complete
VLILLELPFILYATGFGAEGMLASLGITGLGEASHLLRDGAPATNIAMFLHMGLGGLLSLLAPLQLSGALRRCRPRLHRGLGRVIVPLALTTSVAGLAYILLRGTIGGSLMDLGFGLYGLLLGLAAIMTWRFARAGDFQRHRAWALRLIVLALASWIYRLHYTFWTLATGGLYSRPDFTGLFDQIQLFAFYLPYLALLELYLRLRPAPSLTPPR